MGEAARKAADDEPSVWARQEALQAKKKAEWHAVMVEMFGADWRERAERDLAADPCCHVGHFRNCEERYWQYAKRMAKKVREWERQEKRQKEQEDYNDRWLGVDWRTARNGNGFKRRV